MQVFLFSPINEENAKWYVDTHVTKIPAHILQILLNSCARTRRRFPQLKNYNGMPMMPTNSIMNNPFTKWASLHPANFNFLLELGVELCKEYRLRFHQSHFLEGHILAFDLLETNEDPWLNRFPWMIPMAFQDKVKGIYQSYMRYYAEAKNHLAVWSNPRDVPPWYPLEAVEEGRKIAAAVRMAKENPEGLFNLTSQSEGT